MQGMQLELEPYSVICREGDPSSDIYFLVEGKLLICTLSGTQVKVISRISPGEFVGELSFFDGKPRSGHVLTLEKSKLIRISKSEIVDDLPSWYSQIGISITKKIRHLDQVIQENNLRRSNSEESKPLTIEEQRLIFGLINN
jgi:CRP/FNR family cyclic AMP-dependent transcriptional regulator